MIGAEAQTDSERERSFHQIRCQFEFLCPTSWEEMSETREDGVRFCGHCKSNVHDVTTQAELLRHRVAGHCVRIRVERPVAAADGVPALGEGQEQAPDAEGGGEVVEYVMIGKVSLWSNPTGMVAISVVLLGAAVATWLALGVL